MTRKTPHWRLRSEFLLEIMRPNHFSFLCIQAKEVPFGAQTIDFASADLRCCSRTRRIANCIRTIILVLPKYFSIRFVQANNTLHSLDLSTLKWVGRIAYSRRKLAIGNINPSVSHPRPGIASADLRSPAPRWAARRKFFDYPCLVPNPIPIWPKPLRPILSPQCGNANHAGH